jgi:Cd2+/Zn2+-exporting ATPase
MTELSLRLEGLACPTCAGKVEGTLARKAGVEEAKVHFTTGRVQIKYNPEQVEEAELRELIEAMGYDILD